MKYPSVLSVILLSACLVLFAMGHPHMAVASSFMAAIMSEFAAVRSEIKAIRIAIKAQGRVFTADELLESLPPGALRKKLEDLDA